MGHRPGTTVGVGGGDRVGVITVSDHLRGVIETVPGEVVVVLRSARTRPGTRVRYTRFDGAHHRVTRVLDRDRHVRVPRDAVTHLLGVLLTIPIRRERPHRRVIRRHRHHDRRIRGSSHRRQHTGDKRRGHGGDERESRTLSRAAKARFPSADPYGESLHGTTPQLPAATLRRIRLSYNEFLFAPTRSSRPVVHRSTPTGADASMCRTVNDSARTPAETTPNQPKSPRRPRVFRGFSRSSAESAGGPEPKNPLLLQGILWSTPNGIRTRAATLRVRPGTSGRCGPVLKRPSCQGSRSSPSVEIDLVTPRGLPADGSGSGGAGVAQLDLYRHPVHPAA